MAVIRSRKNNVRSRAGTNSWLMLPVAGRVGTAALIGLAAALVVGFNYSWLYAPLAFWDITVLIAITALWISIRNMDAQQTKDHATEDDPGRGAVDFIMLFASVASLAAVFVLIIKAANASGLEEALDIGLGVFSVIVSWTLVHFIYTLRYADLYFKNNDAIDFNSKEAPTYQDFAYLAFTIGMTYQVSDTSLGSSEIRKVARQHAILSYIFGTAIIATVINTLAGLGR